MHGFWLVVTARSPGIRREACRVRHAAWAVGWCRTNQTTCLALPAQHVMCPLEQVWGVAAPQMGLPGMQWQSTFAPSEVGHEKARHTLGHGCHTVAQLCTVRLPKSKPGVALGVMMDRD